jgi:hypothetical protein
MFHNASRIACHASRAFFALALTLSAASAQVRSNPVHQGTGPVSETSTNVGAGSGPVHESGRSVHEGSAGPLSGNAVRDAVTGDVQSGPVSDVSAGPVTTGRSVSGAGAVTDASAGAVKKDKDSPLGESISQPVRDLGPLQERLRAIQPLPGDEATAEGTTEAQEEQSNEEVAVPEAQEPAEPEQPAPDEAPPALEPEAAASDVAVPEVEPEAPVEADPRDAEEPPPTPDSAAPPTSP